MDGIRYQSMTSGTIAHFADKTALMKSIREMGGEMGEVNQKMGLPSYVEFKSRCGGSEVWKLMKGR